MFEARLGDGNGDVEGRSFQNWLDDDRLRVIGRGDVNADPFCSELLL